MKLVSTIVLILLTILAVASGIAKITFMQQDVEFFGKYGFSEPFLFGFGAIQVIGGLLMPFRKTRFTGATIVAITFLVSLVLLLIDGNMPVSIVTTVAILLLGVVMKQSWGTAVSES